MKFGEPIPDTVRQLRAINRTSAAAREIMKLRRLLAACHGISYGDDGELQSMNEKPWIDFARDAIDEIESAICERGNARLFAWARANPEEAERFGIKVHAAPIAEPGEHKQGDQA